MSTYDKPLPRMDKHSKPFWDGVREHKLRLPQCHQCGKCRTSFEKWCASCGSEQFNWRDMSGRGHIWSYCTFHKVYFEGFEPDVPYNVVLVKLEEGPLLVSNLIDKDNDRISVGMAVQAAFDDITDDISLLKFTPSPGL